MAAMQPLLFMLLMFAVFYFILIRPQVKKQKVHQAMLSALKKGDMVVTRGGVIGRISGIKDERELILEVQEKVRIRVLRSAIESKYESAGAEASTAKAA